jgi:serine/threonine protein phosphatase 1
MAERVGTGGVHFLDAASPPGMRLYAIGDVHGRFDLLQDMHARIRDEIERDRPADWRILHVGDYVDRGPQSREVIERLVALGDTDDRVIALLGNHDAGMVDFLDHADKSGLFATHGGRETARSYGVDADFGSDRLARWSADRLLSAMPPGHVEFLRSLPRSVAFGDYFFCHAGIRPGVPLARQDPEDLIWIRRAFLDSPLLHEKVIVHGHTPAAEPEIMPNRVNIDTGAYYSGILTAISMDGPTKRLLQVAL